jgi:hypothetical protein
MEIKKGKPTLATIIGTMQGRIKASIEFLDKHYQSDSSYNEAMIQAVKETLQETINQSEKLFQQHLDSYK